jgi:hypothetical protein
MVQPRRTEDSESTVYIMCLRLAKPRPCRNLEPEFFAMCSQDSILLSDACETVAEPEKQWSCMAFTEDDVKPAPRFCCSICLLQAGLRMLSTCGADL